ncbi:hypothetical protein V5F77_20295 [Xanthobacter sp. DSM 24535]|uniref:hypothetical protein n=1 Tax=Roseixanthobacter psychrophilus TaxID=3119917 RepID=UPI003727EC72
MNNDQSQPTRTWWPEFLVDEVMPPGKAHPTDWILWDGGGAAAADVLAFRVGGSGADDDGDDPSDVYAMWVTEIECLDFTWSEPRGSREVTVYPDGTYRVEGGAPADFTNCWEMGEPESCAETLEEFAREFASNARDMDNPEVVAVHFLKWGDQPFRLQIVDGAPTFVSVQPSDGEAA